MRRSRRPSIAPRRIWASTTSRAFRRWSKRHDPGDVVLIESIPEALSITKRVCSSINVASTRAGINMDAIATMGARARLAKNTADAGGIGCAKLVTFANMPEDNPFVAGANHGIGEGGATINVGVSGPGCRAVGPRRLRESMERLSVTDRPRPSSACPSRSRGPVELIGREVAGACPLVRFGIVDRRWPRRRRWATALLRS